MTGKSGRTSSARGRTAGGLVAAVLVLGGLSGCGGLSVVTEGDVTLLVYNSSLLPRDGDDAQVTGAVAVANGCVGMASATNPDRVQAVIWPSGTEIDQVDPFTLRLPSGELVTEGTIVQGAGGYTTDPTRLEVEIPESCGFDVDQEVAVFNADDNPIVPE